MQEHFVDIPTYNPDSDRDGYIYEEWLVDRLRLLPKKGDLALCKNWRGICLLDIASKILSSVLVKRMQILQEREGMEAQTGLRHQRGTIDGSFSTIMGLRKRREHQEKTWALFIDLQKAFDLVVREATFKILHKFGPPQHFINIVI